MRSVFAESDNEGRTRACRQLSTRQDDDTMVRRRTWSAMVPSRSAVVLSHCAVKCGWRNSSENVGLAMSRIWDDPSTGTVNAIDLRDPTSLRRIVNIRTTDSGIAFTLRDRNDVRVVLNQDAARQLAGELLDASHDECRH